jgi:hypothetical protein
MKAAYINRTESSEQGTFGTLFVPHADFRCFSGEPPWKNNRKGVSCIPTGKYLVNIRQSHKYGTVYHVRNVIDRSYILIHSGNLCGDIEKGLKSHTSGCILLGQTKGWLLGQKAILNSRAITKKFMKLMDNEPFLLTIL